MPRDADVVSPRAGLVRGALAAWAVLVYVFLFAPIVLLVAAMIIVLLIIFRRSLEVEDAYRA